MKYIECQCSDSSHLVRIATFKDEKEIYIQTQMTREPFFRRLKLGFLYVFFPSRKETHWQETMLDRTKTEDLASFLNDFLEQTKDVQ